MREHRLCEIDADAVEREALTAVECGGICRSERKLASYEGVAGAQTDLMRDPGQESRVLIRAVSPRRRTVII